MFYNQVILTKKGVLGKVWLAAHWERKLTKAQVFETNIQSSVNDILHPKVKLALRTSGHLLLGVVRIYSKKAKYLLSDCNEVLAKLKLAFRPTTSIDLPKSQQEARREAITLQRKSKLPMLDLEATSQSFQRDLHLDDMSEDELSERLSVARASRVEDITLKDDILAASRSDVSRPDDTFGDVDFEDLDLGADEQDIDIDLSSTHGGRRQEQVDADFDDDLLAPVAAPEVDIDMPPPPEPENIIDDDGMDNAIDNEAHGPAGDISMLNIEGFALPPLDLSTTANNKLSRRRRKLIVDEFKNLTGEQIKQQLNDPSDLVGGLDLAPPSTTIMQLREAERSEKTAMTTATYYEANYICEELTRNLHFRISAPPVARLEEFCDFLGIDMSRSETTQTSEGNQLCFYFADCAPNLCSEFDNFVSQYETDRANQAAALRELEDHAVLSNDAGPMPAAGAPSSQEAPASPAAPIPMARDLTPDRGLLPGVAADVSMPAPLAPNVSAGFDVSGAAPNIDLLPLDDIGAVASPSGKRSRSPAGGAKSSKKRKTQALEEVAEDAEEGEDGQKADDDLRMNPKTRQLFKTIQRNVQKRQQKAEPAAAVDANGKKKKIKAFVMFDELLANQKSRKEVARRFYSLLVMTKLQAVRVQQKRPYADIKITAGAKFNKF